MAELLKGKPVADDICAGLEPRIGALRAENVVPTLAIIRVGNREDDLAYERSIEKRFAALGLDVVKTALDENCTQGELIAALEAANEDETIHGCLMFRPLPTTLDETAACNALAPEKDVDGITPGSLYGVFADKPVGFPPCTAEACVKLLEHYEKPLEGANVTVIGRSLVIGRPVAMLLQAKNATVTMCHTRTRDLRDACAGADIVIAAAGKAGVVDDLVVSDGHSVVDVGINWDAEANKLVGDAAFDAVEPIVDAITPVPGGVGSVTTAVLAEHVVRAAERAIS